MGNVQVRAEGISVNVFAEKNEREGKVGRTKKPTSDNDSA